MRIERWIGDLPPKSSLPREGKWIAPPEKASGPVSTEVLVLAAIGVFGWTDQILKRFYAHPLLGFVASLAVCGTAAWLFLQGLRVWRDLRARSAGEPLLDGGFGDQFAARIAIVARGRSLGRDQGVVWFADGLMGFSGRAASFVLAASDVRVRTAATPDRFDSHTPPMGAIEFVGIPGTSYLTLIPFKGTTAAFRERLKRFETEIASPDAERHWPPLVPYGEEKRPVDARRTR